MMARLANYPSNSVTPRTIIGDWMIDPSRAELLNPAITTAIFKSLGSSKATETPDERRAREEKATAAVLAAVEKVIKKP